MLTSLQISPQPNYNYNQSITHQLHDQGYRLCSITGQNVVSHYTVYKAGKKKIKLTKNTNLIII